MCNHLHVLISTRRQSGGDCVFGRVSAASLGNYRPYQPYIFLCTLVPVWWNTSCGCGDSEPSQNVCFAASTLSPHWLTNSLRHHCHVSTGSPPSSSPSSPLDHRCSLPFTLFPNFWLYSLSSSLFHLIVAVFTWEGLGVLRYTSYTVLCYIWVLYLNAVRILSFEKCLTVWLPSDR